LAQKYEVAIVGGGPVGIALAVELGQRGIRTAVVERHRAPQRIPKGQNLTNRTLEHFYFWKCVDELRAARVLPPGYPTGGITHYESLTSPYFQTMQWGGRGAQVEEFYFERNERLPQYCTEAVLRDRLKDLPSVRALFGAVATRVEESSEGVRVSVTSVDDGAAPFFSWAADTPQQVNAEADARGEVIEAEYVVGCDGGRSLVRESMGIDRGGRDFDQRMVLMVFRSKELHAYLERFPPATTYRVMKPELKGYWQFFGRVDVGEGFFFHAPAPADAALDNFDALGLLHEAAGFDFQAELDHVGFWDMRIMVATRYSKGRMFIAGDACHQHPPYGGYGLNTGLEDAANLGWKLAARLQGWGGPRLLDSYGEERRPIFVETGEAMIAGGIERDREFLERYSPERDPVEFEHEWLEMNRTSVFGQQAYEPHYEGSSVVAGPPNGVCSIHAAPRLTAEAGHHLAPRVLSDGRNVFEALGAGFSLLAFDAPDVAVAAFASAAEAAGAPLTIVRDTFAESRTAYAARMVLVRPDQYVVWAGDTSPGDVSALWRRATGR